MRPRRYPAVLGIRRPYVERVTSEIEAMNLPYKCTDNAVLPGVQNISFQPLNDSQLLELMAKIPQDAFALTLVGGQNPLLSDS